MQNPTFRPNQLEAVLSILGGNSVVMIKTTGGGKTLPVLVTACVLNDIKSLVKTILYIAPTKVILNMVLARATAIGLISAIILQETLEVDRITAKERLRAGREI